MAKKITFIIAVLIMAAVALQGCYTILKHPRVELADYSHEEYARACQECHTNIAEYPYGYSSISYPDYWGDYHRWGDYYAYPWWWEPYWWNVYGDGVKIKENDDYDYPGSIRPGHRRGIQITPWDTELGPEEVTNQNPPSGGGGSGGGTSTGSGDDGGNQDDGQNNEGGSTKEKEKKENKKPERRRLP